MPVERCVHTVSRPRLRVAAVALLAVLAGCSALVPAGTPTATPAPVPTEPSTPTATPMLAPGLSGAGVTDPLALATAHGSVLRNRSYTVHDTVTERAADGRLLRRRDVTRRSGPNGTRGHAVYDLSGPRRLPIAVPNATRVELYIEGTDGYVAGTNATGTYYERFAVDPVAGDRTLFALLASADPRVAGRTTRNGTTLYRLRADRVPDPEFLAGAIALGPYDEVSNGSMTALVDPRGFVHEYRITFRKVVDGNRTRVTRTVRYRAVGSTTVERPAWVDETAESGE